MIEFYLQCLSFAVTLIAIYVCLKWFNFSFIKKQVETVENETDVEAWRKKQNKYRIAIWLVALLFDAYVYFSFNYEGAMYLGVMLLISGAFLVNTKKKKD